MALVTDIRWKIWELSVWLSFRLCPDKKALSLMSRIGTEGYKELRRMQEEQSKPE